MSAPAATTQVAELPPNSVKNILSPRDSSYIVNKADLRSFLERKYNRTDFVICTKNGRWIFMAQEKVPPSEINNLIKEIQANTDRERAERAAATPNVATQTG